MRHRRLPLLLVLCGLRLGLTHPAVAQGEPPRLQELQATIHRTVLRTLQAGPIPYLATSYDVAALTIQAYPTYYYSEPTGGPAGYFELRPDTLAGYAALYQQGKLLLTARAGGGGRYAFYPVNPPLAQKQYGLGSRDSTSYDIKLVQATLPYRSRAFILKIPPRLSPDIMGYSDQGELRFVNERGHVYRSAEELLVATFGSRARYLDLRNKVRQQAQDDQKWYQTHSSSAPAPPVPNK
jgi:hypothetical protein